MRITSSDAAAISAMRAVNSLFLHRRLKLLQKGCVRFPVQRKHPVTTLTFQKIHESGFQQ